MPTGSVPPQDPLVIAGRAFSSRLLLGTGKFPSSAVMAAAARAAGTEIVTVALRRGRHAPRGKATQPPGPPPPGAPPTPPGPPPGLRPPHPSRGRAPRQTL